MARAEQHQQIKTEPGVSSGMAFKLRGPGGVLGGPGGLPSGATTAVQGVKQESTPSNGLQLGFGTAKAAVLVSMLPWHVQRQCMCDSAYASL